MGLHDLRRVLATGTRQLFSTSVCAWAEGATAIIAATAIVKVPTGMVLKTRRFMFLQIMSRREFYRRSCGSGRWVSVRRPARRMW
ncbi:hypothetical protein I553_0100 [Mycobacterium xenopi 4042]|uniref:Uncharacterized protein n=1 Tax=Mycobacterium xenopi 4042 TaxID=1299334 RepID=X7YI51_MYCXE|nr:hypothetical protein I553_0100 [Mycobacterium xenopi 4042]